MKSKSHKLPSNLKSQAALEFLTTYGWAFLVILIMIGALAYFGVLNPSRLLPDRCNFGPEMDCQDFHISLSPSPGIIKVKLKNNVGEAINIVSPDGLTISTEAAAELSCSGAPDTSGIWKTGARRDLTFSGCNLAAVGFVAGEKAKVSIKLRYYAVRSGIDYAHDVSGEIFGTVI